MVTRTQMNFHETFQPETSYISKIMALASKGYTGTKQQISEDTGIPTGLHKGKVEPHIRYASYMGLITFTLTKGQYHIMLTPLGQEVFAQDPYLSENLTRWICHVHMAHAQTGAPQWTYLFHHAHFGFAEAVSCAFVTDKANRFYGLSLSPAELFGVARRTYTDGIFEPLHLLAQDEQIRFLSHMEHYDLLYLYGYTLLHSWAQAFPEQREITISDVQNSLGFGRLFGLHEDDIQCVLDALADEGFISVNRQLIPATIIRMAQADDLIPNLYRRLL